MRVEFTHEELAETCNSLEGLQRQVRQARTAVKLALSTLQAAEGSLDALPNVSSGGGTTVIRTSTSDVVLDLAVENGTATISRISTRPLNGRE